MPKISRDCASRSAWCCVVLMLFLGGVQPIIASNETIVVKLSNGKNGKPLAHFRVYIVFGDPKAQDLLNLKTDHEGEVRFEVGDAKTFQVRPVGAVACGEQPIGAPYRDYSIDDVLKQGIVTQNSCGRFSPGPIRGQITYLVRPASWSELFRN